MINLFIDTSDKDVSIGIIKEDKILAQRKERIPNKHSVYTTSYVKQVLNECNLNPDSIDKIIVVTGPGSFTGVRIGVTIAKVYAYLLNKDIIGVSSLKILALSSSPSKCYLSLIDAKHDNYYMGLYDENYNEIVPSKFANIKEIEEIINKYNPTIISNDNLEIANQVVTPINLDLVKIVNYYKDSVSENPHLVNPEYLKLPEAMEKK